MLDEAARIGSPAGLPPERVLQGCEGTDPATELDGGSPNSGGKVQVGDPRPPQHQQPTKYYEQDKEEVKPDNKIRENSVQRPTARPPVRLSARSAT